jgi:hypothetical protein
MIHSLISRHKSFLIAAILILPNLFSFSSTWQGSHANWYYSRNNLAYEGYQHYQKLGDTLIAGILCDNIICVQTGYDYTIAQVRSDSHFVYTYVANDTVFAFSGAQSSILYISSAIAGDHWPVKHGTDCNNAYFVVDSTGSILIGGTMLKTIYGTYYTDSVSFLNSVIVDGIGERFSLVPEFSCLIDDYWTDFRCYSDSNLINYDIQVALSCDFINSTQEISIQHFTVFPNPANDIINVDLTRVRANMNDMEIVVSDLSGRIIISIKASNSHQTINCSDLPNGIYMIEIKSKTNSIGHERFVKL